MRVYPDEIAAELGSLMTSDTAEAGRQFWREGWQYADELDAWRRLVQRYPAHVAAAIVDAQRPTNHTERPNGEPFWAEPPVPPTAETATTRVLPDCWIAVGYRNGTEALRYVGRAIVEPLALSPRRDVADDDPTLVDRDGLRLEPALLWTVDFEQAAAVGMGLRIPIDQLDFEEGFDRLVVYGVKTTLSATAGKARLVELLDGHRRSRGLALVRQGTPTNNSAEGDAGYPPPDDADRSFAIERGPSLVTAGSDGDVLAKALGLPADVFAHVEGADRLEQRRAAAMNQALWPCTLGYFLEEMMAPMVDGAMRKAIRDHYIAFVRGRGPLPAFRVGRVPYGILPVTPLVGAEAPFEATLVSRLVTWRLRMLEAAVNVARVGRTPGDPDADLLGIFAVDASCREVRQREVVGPAYLRAVLQLFGADPDLGAAKRATFTDPVLLALGLQGAPRVASMTFDNQALRVNRPMVTADPLSEDAPLADDYIAAMCASATVFDLSPPGPPPHPDRPLLYHLLRQSTLVEYADVATVIDTRSQPVDRREVELVQIAPGTLDRLSPQQRFASTTLRITEGLPVAEYILDPPPPPTVPPGPPDAREAVQLHLAALQQLVGVPTAELERLMTETLDTCSHRVDAWQTSLASMRLATMRDAQAEGIYLGAYAFVENLRARTEPLPGAVGGFIHAPSATHATAAAVLRNGYLTRDGAEEVAIDLSSQRVRRALALADGVRQGQPPGTVLGYWFERALHDRELDRYIAPFRRLYPLGRLPGPLTEQTTEQIAARNVVNGLALRDAMLTWTTLPWGDIEKLPPVDAHHQAGVLACLEQLDADVDAAADLFAAESVYQIVQGNTDRAAANLASGAGTGNLPLPGIVTPPTSGTAFTHRVAIVLGDAPPTSPWPAGSRRVAEPRLDAWLGRLLGDPAAIQCRATHEQGETVVTVQALGLCALDFVVLARRTDTSDELAARVIAHVSATFGGITGAVAVDFSRPTNPPWPLTVFSFDEALETARLAGELIGGARPLGGDDVVPPHAAGTPFTVHTDAMDERVSQALPAFAAARLALDAAVVAAGSPTPPAGSLDKLRGALWSAAGFGVREAVPVALAGDAAAVRAALLTQAAIVQTALADRADDADDATTGADRLAALFGPELPLLVPFTPANRPDLDTALASPPSNRFETRRWLQRMARIREPLDRLRLAHLASDAMTGATLSPTGFVFDIAQLPFQSGAPWIGQSFDPNDEARRPRAGTVAIAMHRPAGFDTSGSWAGLLVDNWTETIPSATQLTSYAIHHQAPGAEAPQCVVLAVPPQNVDIPTWALWVVEACLEQTFDVARMRAVDSDLLHPYALMTPCIYLAANVADDAVRSPLGEMRIKEAVILAPE